MPEFATNSGATDPLSVSLSGALAYLMLLVPRVLAALAVLVIGYVLARLAFKAVTALGEKMARAVLLK